MITTAASLRCGFTFSHSRHVNTMRSSKDLRRAGMLPRRALPRLRVSGFVLLHSFAGKVVPFGSYLHSSFQHRHCLCLLT
jgi:hypothetical protein